VEYKQHLREAALDITKHEPVETKAMILNIMETIFDEELSVDQIVDAIGNDTLPKRYIPISHE
jgi:hypothetical protein